MAYCFGVDYYPEHWPRGRWETDARMMREMGIDIVRMGEFSWSLLEPERGRFTFEWLEDAVSLMAAHGIKSILGTPTAAPPAWIIAQNPEIQPVDAKGLTRFFGGRHHDCQSNHVYREHIRRYVTAFAKRFGSNPHVIGFQVDNELGNSHGDLCLCPECEKRFQTWLKTKYGTIEGLNRRWGTVFWSQGYQDFSQIQAPKTTASGQNPSQLLDWKRFCSDLIVDFHRFQADILRAAAPDKFITHNMMGFADKVSYYDLSQDLDFASHDQYPGGHFHAEPSKPKAERQAAELDFIRSVKQKPFWIMEQQSGITGWEILGRTPKPGQLALWASQCIAHGADTVVFFRWRSCLYGTEQYWHGILPHSGVPGRYHQEISAFMQSTRPLLEAIQGAMPPKETAILFSYDQEYALQIQPHHPDLHYVGHLMTYYKALFKRSLPVDFVSEQDDFSGYRALIAPLQYLMDASLAGKLAVYAQNGGTLVLTLRAGIKDRDNNALDQSAPPVMLSGLAGVEVAEYDCLRDVSMQVLWDGARFTAQKWCDILRTTTACPLAAYADDFYAGTPAITVNAFGKGRVYYVGTEMSEALSDRFIAELIETAGLNALAEPVAGVEVACRVTEHTHFFFVLNHTDEIKDFTPPPGWKTFDKAQSNVLAPYGVRVYTLT